MNLVLIAETLGNLSYSMAAVLLLPLMWAVAIREGAAAGTFFLSAFCALLVGGFLKQYSVRPHEETIKPRDAVAIAGIGWMLASLLSFLPYFLGGYLSFLDSMSESVSGLSGTGVTFIGDLDVLPRSLLLWRSLTNWAGGIGIILIFMAILPQFGRGAANLLRVEETTLVSERHRPRIRDYAGTVLRLYAGLTTLCIGGCRLLGLSWYDAINHGLTAISTGGFSPYNDGLMHFDSPALEAWIFVSMIAASGSFALYVRAWQMGVREGWRVLAYNTEFRAYVALSAAAAVLVVIDLMVEMGYSVGDAVRYGVFQTVSLSSTTGFVTFDFDLWPSFTKAIFLLLMFLGGCAGSTAGGFKMMRFVIVLKLVAKAVREQLHPQAVSRLFVQGTEISSQTQFNVARHFFVYFVLDMLFAVCLIADGIPLIEAVSVAITTMASVGPGFGLEGATSTYASLPEFSKGIACVAMFFGRLEIFTVLTMMSPGFWRKDRNWA